MHLIYIQLGFLLRVMSALGGVVQLKSIAIEERPIGRLHWSAYSSQKRLGLAAYKIWWPEMKVRAE